MTETAQIKPQPVSAPQPPLSGFMHRTGAFLIDLVLLYFAGYSLELFAGNALAVVGSSIGFISAVAAFVYFWLGNGPGEGGCYLHNPHYDFNDEALPIGASFLARLAERFLAVGAVGGR